jgi:hypothetical protein
MSGRLTGHQQIEIGRAHCLPDWAGTSVRSVCQNHHSRKPHNMPTYEEQSELRPSSWPADLDVNVSLEHRDPARSALEFNNDKIHLYLAR